MMRNEPHSLYAIFEQGDGSSRTSLGIGRVHRDGSLTLTLDALPTSRTLDVRAIDTDPSVPMRAVPLFPVSTRAVAPTPSARPS